MSTRRVRTLAVALALLSFLGDPAPAHAEGCGSYSGGPLDGCQWCETPNCSAVFCCNGPTGWWMGACDLNPPTIESC